MQGSEIQITLARNLNVSVSNMKNSVTDSPCKGQDVKSSGEMDENSESIHALPPEIMLMVIKIFCGRCLTFVKPIDIYYVFVRYSPSSPGVTWDQQCWCAGAGPR